MIIGQSLVLYSRLYLVVDSRMVMWFVRAMIGTTFVAFLVPAPVSFFLDNANQNNPSYVRFFSVVEMTQLCCFLSSETVLSITYIIATWRVLRSNAVIKVKRVVRLLIVTNLVIIALDILVLTMEILGWYAFQATLKPTAYAIKFKLEFAFLNQLLFISKIGYNFVRDPRRPPKQGVHLQDRVQTEQTKIPSPRTSRDGTGENWRTNQNQDCNSWTVPKTRLSMSNVSCHLKLSSGRDSTNAGRSSQTRSYQSEDCPPPIEAYHPWEIDEQAMQYNEAELTDLESRPSVTTEIEAAANQDRSTLSGLQRRNSNDNLGAEMSHRLRRAEIGLRDFA